MHLISFDSTIRSNLSWAWPSTCCSTSRQLAPADPHRITADDPYFNKLRRGWGEGLRKTFEKLPDEDWFNK